MANTKVPIELSSTPGIVDNSTATAITIDASENVGIGVSTPALGLSVYKQSDTSFTNLPANIYSYDSTAMAAGVGGGIWFGGRHVTGSESATTFAAISGIKANGTSTNTAGALTFGVRDSSGGVAIERMRIDSAGNVGIGTTTPEARLHASGGENSVHAVFGTRATRGLEIGTMIGGDGATDNTAFYNMKFSSNGSHVWQAGGVERMRIDSAGNLLVGTTATIGTNALGKVQIRGGESYITINDEVAGYVGLNSNADNSVAIWADPDNLRTGSHIVFYVDGVAEKMRIGSSGIITHNMTSGSAFSNYIEGGSNRGYIGSSNSLVSGGLTGFCIRGESAINFSIAGANNMTLDASGRLLVGTTANIGGARLNVAHPTDCIGVNLGPSASGQRYFMYFTYNGTNVGSIKGDTSATYYNTSSDYRLKEDDVPMTGATERVKALRPINFAWKVDGSRTDGFFAHEAQEVVPECSTGTKDAMRDEEYEVTPAVEEVRDEDGNVTTEAVPAVMGTRSVPDYQGIDQSKLVPLLTATIQELIARIEALEGA